MTNTLIRRSPIHHLLEARGATWGRVGDTPIALRFAKPDAEATAMRTLGLCDLSALPKLGIKGPSAPGWLRKQGVDVPAAIYETRRLADDGIIARVAADEFLLESGVAGESVAALSERLGPAQAGAYRVEREDATFLLTGSRAIDVLAQTCGFNFREAEPLRLILTRLAVAPCGVLPDTRNDPPAYRLWVDCTFAVYLWDTLVEICEGLGGAVIGAACVYPDVIPEDTA